MVVKEASIPTLQNFTCATPPGSNQPLLCRACRQATCKETGVFSHDAIAHSGCAGSVFRRRASLKTSKFPGGREREGKEKGYSQHCVSFSTRLAINAWAVPRATYTRIHVVAALLKVLLIAASRIGPGKSRRMSNHTDALGHVWTAPWQELSEVLQHWSGAVMCPACLCGGEAAGHNALRGSGPNR